jgi:hypothetical protein
MGKKEKYGNYLLKIGYFDIRQKVQMPKKRRLNNGGFQTLPGKVEVFVYHGKNQISGPFKSHVEAIKSAETLLTEGYRFNKHRK